MFLGKQGCFDVLSGGSSLSQHVATESGKTKTERETSRLMTNNSEADVLMTLLLARNQTDSSRWSLFCRMLCCTHLV